MAQKRKDSLLWGTILIIIGLLFLLQNINVDVLDIMARLWPVILIAWGSWKLYFGIKEKRQEVKKE